MCAVRPFPRLCVGRLRDLRNHLDALLGSSPGDSSRARGADHAPEATPRAGPVRRPPDRYPIPRERREAMVEILRALLTEALSDEAAIPIRKEAHHEPDRG